MKYCSVCGEKVEQKIPENDTRHRYVCDGCGTIHYQNPNIVAGTIPVYEGKILLCRRAIEPRHGFWTLPAGFMENQETTMEAAARETWEEAEARACPKAAPPPPSLGTAQARPLWRMASSRRRRAR